MAGLSQQLLDITSTMASIKLCTRDQVQGLREDQPLVMREVRRERKAREVALQQDVGLGAGRVELGLRDLVLQVLLQDPQQMVLAAPDWDVLELAGLRQHLQNRLHPRLGVQLLREQLHRVRLYVVVAADVAEVQRQ